MRLVFLRKTKTLMLWIWQYDNPPTADMPINTELIGEDISGVLLLKERYERQLAALREEKQQALQERDKSAEEK